MEHHEQREVELNRLRYIAARCYGWSNIRRDVLGGWVGECEEHWEDYSYDEDLPDFVADWAAAGTLWDVLVKAGCYPRLSSGLNMDEFGDWVSIYQPLDRAQDTTTYGASTHGASTTTTYGASTHGASTTTTYGASTHGASTVPYAITLAYVHAASGGWLGEDAQARHAVADAEWEVLPVKV